MSKKLVQLLVSQRATLKMGRIFLLERARHKLFHKDRLLLLLTPIIHVAVPIHQQTVSPFVFLRIRQTISYIKREHPYLIRLSAAKINGCLTITNINRLRELLVMVVYNIYPWIRRQHL